MDEVLHCIVWKLNEGFQTYSSLFLDAYPEGRESDRQALCKAQEWVLRNESVGCFVIVRTS
jgi:hypothetical protein